MDYDKEIISDFLGEYSDAQLEIENILSLWDESNNNDDSINSLFRAVHTIKGNFRMMGLNPLSETIHLLEDNLSQIRNKQRKLIPGFTILVSVALEQSKELAKQIFSGIDKQNEITCLTQVLSDLSHSPAEKFSQQLLHTLQVIDQMGSYGNDYSCQKLITFLENEEKKPNLYSINDSSPKVLASNKELDFFYQLITQIESFFPFWKNRSDRILKLVSEMNKSAGYPVVPEQLQAAVYLHDIGMSFIPPQTFYTPKELNENDIKQMHSHCEIGFQWLNIIPGWQEAATMVLQHHERYNGSGYPSKIAAEQICDGAKLLAIGDTYASITGQEKKGSQNKPIMFAVMEVNQGAGQQFDPKWVEVFNQVIRKLKQ